MYIGAGNYGVNGENVAATTATFQEPSGIVFGSTGNAYIADWGGGVIRMVTPNGIITTVAGREYST